MTFVRMLARLVLVYLAIAVPIWIMYMMGMAYGASGSVQSGYGAVLLLAASLGFVSLPFAIHAALALLSGAIFKAFSYGHVFGSIASFLILVAAIFQTFAV